MKSVTVRDPHIYEGLHNFAGSRSKEFSYKRRRNWSRIRSITLWTVQIYFLLIPVPFKYALKGTATRDFCNLFIFDLITKSVLFFKAMTVLNIL
jgi:hypothetical protein